ncbi:hypothetical protein [Mesorhizobium silamurunense]|uniref:hypothetical protein n=1 Tax=Mesorhizobium silamurunense TaxID=499528 RepID=UPI00178274C7|nr:hypothetical protein [Mesorhizobium silamurunense]
MLNPDLLVNLAVAAGRNYGLDLGHEFRCDYGNPTGDTDWTEGNEAVTGASIPAVSAIPQLGVEQRQLSPISS